MSMIWLPPLLKFFRAKCFWRIFYKYHREITIYAELLKLFSPSVFSYVQSVYVGPFSKSCLSTSSLFTFSLSTVSLPTFNLSTFSPSY
jgi:hypothetical protein